MSTVHPKDISPDEAIDRASMFPYWEIRDDRTHLLNNTIKDNEKRGFEYWLNIYLEKSFIKVLFIRVGQNMRDSAKNTFWLKTKAAKKMEEEGEVDAIVPAIFQPAQQQTQNNGYPTYPNNVYIHSLGGMGKNNQSPQNNFEQFLQIVEARMAEQKAETQKELAQQKIEHLEEMANLRVGHSIEIMKMKEEQIALKEKELRARELELKKKEEQGMDNPMREVGKGVLNGLVEMGKSAFSSKSNDLSGMEKSTTKKGTKVKATIKRAGSEGKAKTEERQQEPETTSNNILAGLSAEEQQRLLNLISQVKEDSQLLDDFEKVRDAVEYVEEEENQEESQEESQEEPPVEDTKAQDDDTQDRTGD